MPLKTNRLQMSGGNYLWCVYDDGDSTKYAVGLTHAEALFNYYIKEMPPGYALEFHQGMLNADDMWKVTHPDCIGLSGWGVTPELALKDFQEKRETTWWPGRFTLLIANASLEIERSREPGLYDEWRKLVYALRDGTFKLESGA